MEAELRSALDLAEENAEARLVVAAAKKVAIASKKYASKPRSKGLSLDTLARVQRRLRHILPNLPKASEGKHQYALHDEVFQELLTAVHNAGSSLDVLEGNGAELLQLARDQLTRHCRDCDLEEESEVIPCCLAMMLCVTLNKPVAARALSAVAAGLVHSTCISLLTCPAAKSALAALAGAAGGPNIIAGGIGTQEDKWSRATVVHGG